MFMQRNQFAVPGVLRRTLTNTPDFGPFIVYRQAQEKGADVFKIRGPGCSEVYPWPTFEAAATEASRLYGEYLSKNILSMFPSFA